MISNSTIQVNSSQLHITGGVPIRAVGGCTVSGPGSITPACTSTPIVNDPNYAPPNITPAAPAAMPACTDKNQVGIFEPGLYRSADFLNQCVASWLYFKPGVYYFDFTTTERVWTIDKTVVGGTLTTGGTAPPLSAPRPSVPGACVNPITTTSAVGVEFVFGGDTQVVFSGNSNFEICASYSASSIPTAAYGLKAPLGSGADIVSAQTGCITKLAGSSPNNPKPCDLFSSASLGAKPVYYFQGFTYAPDAPHHLAP